MLVYIILFVVGIVTLSTISIISLVLIDKQSKKSVSKLDMKEGNEELKNDVIRTITSVTNSAVNNRIGSINENVNKLEQRIDQLIFENNLSMNQLKDYLNEGIRYMQKENSHQLEEMRKTVDEKLSTTLEQRFTQTFKIVNDRLLEINNTFTSLQGLHNEVSDLGKMFKNVKTRGTWGELSLESLLQQIMTEEQYEVQKVIKKKEGDNGRVDFAIKLPGKGNGIVYLPLDSKFPLDVYEKVVEKSCNGKTEELDICLKNLYDAVLGQAKSIKEKYIQPPLTTDFAIMYVPIEGLYAEIVKSSDLLTKLQTNYSVVVCGPTTLAALLNSLRMGFKSVAIEQKSKEIALLFEKFQKDFITFTGILGKLKDNMNTVQKTIDTASKRTEIISNTLAKATHIELPNNDEDIPFSLLDDNLGLSDDNLMDIE